MTFFFFSHLKAESCTSKNGRSADSVVPCRGETEATCLTSASPPHYVVIILPSAAPFSFGLITFCTLFSICFIHSVLTALPCLPPPHAFLSPLLTSLMTSSLPLFLSTAVGGECKNEQNEWCRKKERDSRRSQEKSERLPAGAAAAKNNKIIY